MNPFLAGVVATLTASHILAKLRKGSEVDKKAMYSFARAENTSEPKMISVMDSPDLDNRILRKAETALRLRTSRLIIVRNKIESKFAYHTHFQIF